MPSTKTKAPTIRELADSYNQYLQSSQKAGPNLQVGWDAGQNFTTLQHGGNLLKFTPGQGAAYGIGGAPNAQTVTNMDQLAQALGLSGATMNSTPGGYSLGFNSSSKAPSTGGAPSLDLTGGINQNFDQLRQANLASLQGKLAMQKSAVEQQRAAAGPQFQQAKVEADTNAMMAGKRLNELLAAQGMGRSGELMNSNTGLQVSRQQELSKIGQAETQMHTSLDQEIANLQKAYAHDESAMDASLGASRMQALLQEQLRQHGESLEGHYRSEDQGSRQEELDYRKWRDQQGDKQSAENMEYQRWRDQQLDSRWETQFEYGKQRDGVQDSRYWNEQSHQRSREGILDERWGASNPGIQDEMDWRKNANNPEAQTKTLKNKIYELQISDIPSTFKVQVEEVNQQLADKTITPDMARLKLMKIEEEANNVDVKQIGNNLYNDIDHMIKNNLGDPVAFLTDGAEYIRNTLGHEAYTKLLKYAQENYAPPEEKKWWQWPWFSPTPQNK